MRKLLPWAIALVLVGGPAAVSAAPKKPTAAAPKTATPPPASKAVSLKCVGLYSETDAGYISFKAGSSDWTVVKVGDVVPADAQVKVTVDRDWVEFTPSDTPTSVFELNGENGAVTKSVADILKGTPRVVKFPKEGAEDPAFKARLVVTQYLGRQIYTDPKGDEKDIKYGDLLATGGKVTIIAINNTITLMNAGSKVTTVIGPLKFEVDKVLKNEKLYKFLNVPK
jgi:hypothetical protein